MNWKNLLESVSESVNDHLRLRNEYLAAENCIMRHQIDGRVQLTDSDRKELAEIGAKLGKKALAEIATVATPETILAWNHKFADQKVKTSELPKLVGRPWVDEEIEDWVIRMARENQSWGYDRIQGALNHLGYAMSDQTVGNILKRNGISPAPERKKTVTWREFTRSHWDVFVATGFFNSKAWNWFGMIVSCLLSFTHFGRHQVHSVRRLLHQHMRGMCTFLLNTLNARAQGQRWSDEVKTVARSRPVLFRLGIRQRSQSGLARPHRQECCPQDIGQVMPLSVAQIGPIRDGPIQSQDLQSVLLKGDLRETA